MREILGLLLTLAALLAILVFMVGGTDGVKQVLAKSASNKGGAGVAAGSSAAIVLVTFEIGEAVASGAQVLEGVSVGIAGGALAVLALLLLLAALRIRFGLVLLTLVGLALGFLNLASTSMSAAIGALTIALLLIALVAVIGGLLPSDD